LYALREYTYCGYPAIHCGQNYQAIMALDYNLREIPACGERHPMHCLSCGM
jgi:hypothetical protein